MRELFYIIVEYITECITGLENGAIKLWELNEYLEVSGHVTIGLNIACALMLALVISCVVDVVLTIYAYRNNIEMRV